MKELTNAPEGEPSANIRARVVAARERQRERFSNSPGVHCNAQMSARQLQELVVLDEAAQDALSLALDRLGLSARAYERVLKVARTIADLEGSDKVQPTAHSRGCELSQPRPLHLGHLTVKQTNNRRKT